MKYRFFFLVLWMSSFSFSQEKFSKEFSFANDNDLFVSMKKDRYYTDGIFLSFRHLSKKKKGNLEKKIIEWQIGHKMYTPFKAIVEDISLHDRPFAGYLYGGFGIHRVYKNDQIFNTSIQIGVLGPSAFGKELQDFIHDLYNFRRAVGWKHQIKNSLGLNINAFYAKTIVKNATSRYDIAWIGEAKAGTIYTSVSSGFYGRIGLGPLQKIANSIAFNTNLNNDKNKYKREAESFLYIKPMLWYAVYDATLQGSFITSNNDDVTKKLIPFRFVAEIGLRFTANRFNFGYIYQYHTSKSEGLRYKSGNKFGTILINYLIR